MAKKGGKMVEKKGKYGVLSPDEVHDLSGKFVKECKDELMRRGEFSKGFRVKASSLHNCVKSKWLDYKRSYKG